MRQGYGIFFARAGLVIDVVVELAHRIMKLTALFAQLLHGPSFNQGQRIAAVDLVVERDQLLQGGSRELDWLISLRGNVPALLLLVEEHFVELFRRVRCHALRPILIVLFAWMGSSAPSALAQEAGRDASALAQEAGRDPFALAQEAGRDPFALVQATGPGQVALTQTVGYSPAVSDSSASACLPPESRYVEASDGSFLHVTIHRPPGDASAAVVLLSQESAIGGECWGVFPEELCAGGFLVLLPDPRGTGLSRSPELLPEEWSQPAIPLRRRFEEDVMACLDLVGTTSRRIGVVATGWTVWIANAISQADPRITHQIWITPDAWPDGEDPDDLSDPGSRLLLVAAQREEESSALAGDLYSQFNDRAELRLLTGVEGGCQLAQHPGLRRGLLDWLAAALSGGAGEMR